MTKGKPGTNAKQKRKKRRKETAKQKRILEEIKGRHEAGETLAVEEIKLLAEAGILDEESIADEDRAAREVAEAIAGGEPEKIDASGDVGDTLNFSREEMLEAVDKLQKLEGDAEEKKTHHEPEEVGSHYSDLPAKGATTFDELDEYREAMDEAREIRSLISDFEMLVGNVIEKSEPGELGDRIVSLGQEMNDRFENPPDTKETKPGIVQQLKAKLTRASINNLPDSDFAYIEPGGKKNGDGKTVPRSLRHFPIHDAAHVRNALARAAQGIKSGGKAAETARKALPKIRAAAKKMGIGQPGKKKDSGIRVEKQKDGTFRWFGWVSNKWRDRDYPAEPKTGGQIIAESAHKEFVDWVWEKSETRMPQLWIWHTPQTAHEKDWDWIDYADGFLLGSGPLTEVEAKMLESLGEKYDLAMSHGLINMDYDSENGIVRKYRTFEGSYLPRDHAANEWTDIDTIKKEVAEMGFTPKRRKLLVDALGEERVAVLEQDTEGKAKALEVLDVEFKDVLDTLERIAEDGDGKEPDDGKEPFEADPVKGLDAGKLSEFLEVQQKAIKDLGTTVKELTGVVVELAKSDDKKIAEKLRPRADVEKDTVPVWERSLSKSKDTELDEENEEDKELSDSEPGLSEAHWLQEALVPTAEQAPVPR